MLLLPVPPSDWAAAGPDEVIAFVYTWGVLADRGDQPSRPDPDELWAEAASARDVIKTMVPGLDPASRWCSAYVINLLERAAVDPRCVTVLELAAGFRTGIINIDRRIALIGRMVDEEACWRRLRLLARLLVEKVDLGAAVSVGPGVPPRRDLLSYKDEMSRLWGMICAQPVSDRPLLSFYYQRLVHLLPPAP